MREAVVVLRAPGPSITMMRVRNASGAPRRAAPTTRQARAPRPAGCLCGGRGSPRDGARVVRSLAADVEPAPQPRGRGPEKLGGGPRSRDAEASVLSSSPSEVYALDWPRTLLERYEVGKEIGRGSFGVVRLAKERWPVQFTTDLERARGGRTTAQLHGRFACKSIPKVPKRRFRRGGAVVDVGTAVRRQKAKLIQEVQFMVSLASCPFSAQLIGAFEDATHAHLVTELCSGGDLRRLLKRRGRLSEREASDVMFTVFHFIAHCHRSHFAFCDVKPANFMLKFAVPETEEREERREGDGQAKGIGAKEQRRTPPLPLVVKGIDFGCSQRVDPKRPMLVKRTGTPAYWAPEVFMRSFGVEADLWSCGMMLHELLVGRLPFFEDIEKCTPRQVQKGVMHGTLDEDDLEGFGGLSAEARDLVLSLLDRNPKTRLTPKEALNHPWMQAYHASSPLNI